ncbi:MAG: DUF4136 domain-containing protein [bacterium]
MKSIQMFLCFSFLFSLMSCSPVSVRTDYDREVNFTKYKTFKWMPNPKKRDRKSVPKGSLLDRRIRRAVERELEAHGFVVKESGKTDAVLAYHIGVQHKVDVNTTGYGYGRWGYRGRSVHVHRYKEGTIVLDIVDPEMKQLIWRGAAVGVIKRMDASEEKINEAIQKVLEKYPPE